MIFKAFLLYPGACCMVGLVAMLGAGIELHLLHKDIRGKDRLGKFVFSTFWTTLFTCFFLKFSSVTKHFLYMDDVTAVRFLYGLIIAVLVATARIGFSAYLHKHAKPCTKEDKQHDLKPLGVIGVILFALGFSFFMLGHFIPATWGGITPEQMIVNLMSSTEGTELSIYLTGFEYVILAVGFTVLFGIVSFRRVHVEIHAGKRIVTVLSRRAKAVLCFVLAAALFAASVFFFNNVLSMSVLYKCLFKPSDFLEKEYVDLRDVRVTFPDKKRNLIFVFLESVENTYMSKELGGYMETNLMPELTELAYEGDVFSNTSGKFGGPIQITGTEWTVASMVNQTLGVPMKAPMMPMKLNAYSTPDHFLGAIYGLGDLLHDNGYDQLYLAGSSARFGGLDLMYRTHGGYEIKDYNYAQKTGKIPPDYKVWWGFEDDKLFAFAKEELLRMAQNEKPFNLTMDTCDTHATGGYLPDGAPEPYDSHYANSIAYSTHKVTQFVRWVQQQPFYENTTIVLIGDHHSMDGIFFKDVDQDYLRTTFNLILNPAGSVAHTDASRFVNRTYANFDMLPTTLAAIGCEIEGDRAGIGTNLYADQKTLLETYGIAYTDGELQKRSDFYNNTLVDVR